jgi:Domain of unknown function (DUF1893)
MIMQDVEIAKTHLYEKELTLVIVKNGQILFQTDSHRISGFICAIEELGCHLEGASVADRVVGKALALLCVYAEIGSVYADVLSENGKALFEQYNVGCQWKKLVENVLDLTKTDVCPFEKAAADISDPENSYVAFKALMAKMKPCL